MKSVKSDLYAPGVSVPKSLRRAVFQKVWNKIEINLDIPLDGNFIDYYPILESIEESIGLVKRCPGPIIESVKENFIRTL